VLAKVGLATIGGAVTVMLLVAGAVHGLFGTLFGNGGAVDCARPITDIPTNYCHLYVHAARECPGLEWSILAAIGKIESDHGRLNAPGVTSGENFAGAGGPMQFLAPTFDSVTSRHIIPPGGRTPPSRYDPHDAIHAAAYYLCDSGARDGKDLYRAIFTYNRADWYVRKVLDQATIYAQAASNGSAACATHHVGHVTAPIALAVRFACDQLGELYVWGGDGGAEGGWDCSGLTQAAYWAAGIKIPRVAQDQYNAGPVLPAGTPLRAGDLVFYGAGTASITHVGIAISTTHMVNAPEPGTTVRVDQVGRYLAATRPAASIAS
jgi:cell wall-associated NlpC family hydrolase